MNERLAELRQLSDELLQAITDLIVDQRGDVPPELDEAQNSAQEARDLLKELS